MQSLPPKKPFHAEILYFRRLDALRQLHAGSPAATVARDLGVSRQALYRWVRQYRQHGYGGLWSRPRLGRRPKLGYTQLARLSNMLAG